MDCNPPHGSTGWLLQPRNWNRRKNYPKVAVSNRKNADINETNTLRLLKVMDNNRIKNLIYSSTAAVYGIPADIPVVDSRNPVSAKMRFATGRSRF